MNQFAVQFTPFEIQLCLYDKERTKYFSKALKKIIKPESVVVDAGSGTGILGLLAVKYGASKVYCIEADKRFCGVIKENAKRNNFADKIVVINGDATKVKIPEKVDVIIAEIISGGFFFEPQVQVVNHLRKFLKKNGKIIPERIDSYAELINAQEKLYGLKFNYDSRYLKLKDKSITDKKLVFTADFTKYFSPEISAKINLKGKNDGTANAIRISSKVKLIDGIWMNKKTEFFLNPEVIYFKKPLKIYKNKIYELELNYMAAGDTLNANIAVDKQKLL